MHYFYSIFFITWLLVSCKNDTSPTPNAFHLTRVAVDDKEGDYTFSEISQNPVIRLTFSNPVDPESAEENIKLYGASANQELYFNFENNDQILLIQPKDSLQHITKYELTISEDLQSRQEQTLQTVYQITLHTQIDSSYKFPEISEEELLTKVQEQTFKYFWDFAHPVSGLARERNTSGDIVTTGGSGFGLMAIVVGMERGFISRTEGIERLQTIIGFLSEKAERFHGAWSHWLNGSTGEAVAFSTKDNGGDLVETSFLTMGLITVREYLDSANAAELSLRNAIDTLWHAIEWDWFTQGGQNVLYWHWSPNFNWEMNMPIKGYNEALITYVLAASSPTYAISADVYHQGWAQNGDIQNGNSYLGIKLPLGVPYGGPLFFTHYSFLGLNPTNLTDTYANYWEQNQNHALINHAYCIENPKNYVGYSSNCWGLTASDGNNGYSAHAPNNDRGVIAPTAAIASMPYTPEQSKAAIKHFYYVLGDKLWGKYGFYDAFNLTEDWMANSYLAIDQGPIIVMIENYRTGLCWNLFMKNKAVQNGLSELGFSFQK